MIDVSALRPDSTSAADFVLGVLAASSEAPFGTLGWPEINRLAARWLSPIVADAEASGVDTTRVGHALVMEMAAEGLVEAETTTAADGSKMVARVVHPRFFGVEAARRLAA